MRIQAQSCSQPLFRGLMSMILTGLAFLATSGLATAQTSPYSGPVGGHPLVTIPTAFSWSAAAGLGTVQVPLPTAYGWFVMKDDNLEARVVPSLTGDPTIEAIFYPPASGHPNKAERITFQFPLKPKTIPGSGAMVIAFHSYGVSEKDIWVNTQIAQLCAQRGWLLVAPYGLIDTHYGNVESQKSVDAVLTVVEKYFDYDPKRVYTIGFSMGGGAAVSYAMRKQSKTGLRVAGVINHTGTMDLLNTYNLGSPAVKQMLENNLHFHDAPTSADTKYPYERVSPAIFPGSVLDKEKMPIRNLGHMPMYTYVNLNDPLNNLVMDNLAVANELLADGVNVNLVTDSKGFTHNWSTLDLNAAFDWIDRSILEDDSPPKATFFADRQAKYLYTEVRTKDHLRVARYDIEINQIRNELSVLQTKHIELLALDLRDMGLSTDSTLSIRWSTQELMHDRLVLKDYRSPPSEVKINGIINTTWTHDPATAELTIGTPTGSKAAQILVKP